LADGRARVGDSVLEAEEFELTLKPTSEASSRVLSGQRALVVLDTEPDAELEAEGVARDVLRVVQRRRKEIGLDVADRIRLTIASTADIIAALHTHRQMLTEAVLAVVLELVVVEGPLGAQESGAGDQAGVSDVADFGTGEVTLELGDDVSVTLRMERAG